jgi:hypothetical protein
VTILKAGTATITAAAAETTAYAGATASYTLTVGPKALTVTADAKAKTAGEPDAELTYTATGLVGSDTLSGALSREPGEDVGSYAITQGTLTAGDNYALSFTGATLTITALPTFTVTVVNGTGGGNYAAGATVTVTANAPASGKLFDRWSGEGVTFANAAAATTTFPMPAQAVTVTATYKDAPAPVIDDGGVYTGPSFVQELPAALTFDGGTVAVSPAHAVEGERVTLTARAEAGWHLASLTVTRGSFNVPLSRGGNVRTFIMPGGSVEIKAAFARDAAQPVKPAPAVMPPVVLSPQRLTVNGAEATVEAYNIGGTNFFKLRDLAALLRGTPAQFNVDYDAARNAAVVTRGAAYGGEAAAQFSDHAASAVPSPQTIEIDGQAVSLTAYNIGGANFFGLRELAAIFGYQVDYDPATNTAIVESR